MLGNEDRLHSKRLRHSAGVLRSGTAEGKQRVIGGIVALADRNAANGVRHVLDGKAEQRMKQFRFRQTAVSLRMKFAQAASCGVEIERDRGFRRVKAAEEEVHVRDRQRPTFAIAGGAGIGSRAFRTDGEAVVRHLTNGTTTCGDGLDGHARCEQLHAGDLLGEAIARMGVDAGDIRAGASHVEGDDLRDVQPTCCIRRADGAAGRTAEQHVLRTDVFSGLQAAGTGHDQHVR